MFLNIKISKATPEKAFKYASGKNLLEHVEKRNLYTDNPAKEMRATATRYGKWTSDKDRKTFSLIISPNPSDNPTQEQVMEVTKAVLDKYFENIQGIIVLHKDKGKDSAKSKPVLHAHFYGSVIDPITGKNVHLSDSDVRKIRAWADKHAESRFGWKAFSRGQDGVSRKYRKSLMHKIKRDGKASWMSELKTCAEDAYSKAVSFNDFQNRLQDFGINFSEKSSKSGEFQFLFSVNEKPLRVNATTVNNKFSTAYLIEKFTDFRRTDNDRQQRTNTPKAQMGRSSSLQTTTSGSRSGEGHVGKQNIDFGCIICTQDKLICRKCKHYIREGGDNSHGCRTR